MNEFKRSGGTEILGPCVRTQLAIGSRKPNSDWLKQVTYLLTHLTISLRGRSDFNSMSMALLVLPFNEMGTVPKASPPGRTKS